MNIGMLALNPWISLQNNANIIGNYLCMSNHIMIFTMQLSSLAPAEEPSHGMSTALNNVPENNINNIG